MPRIIDQDTRFVAFVGAGASAMSPSSLPTWTGFNNLVLETLLETLGEYTSQRQPTTQMLETFRTRRDKTTFFAPDFQAQLMEEEVGGSYFSVWQSIDSDVYGPVHAALAELASRGQLAAIITTNFDRLIERALTARGQSFEVFHDVDGFQRLATNATTTLPIIKIHGSIEDAASLVDTLRQRVAGRPEALMTVLQRMLREHAWLYLGFSGADFSYDRHYLGVLDAAADAKGFVFLARPQSDVQAGVREIAAAYGPDKASIEAGEMSAWLVTRFQLPPFAAAIASVTDTGAHIKTGIQKWAGGLGSIAVVNIVCAMLTSAGLGRAGFWLMRKTWKTYRTTEDTQSRSYPRYNYNYGASLFDSGLISNPVALAEDKSNVFEWKAGADENAFEFLARSYKEGNLLCAGGLLSSVMAYRGEIGRAIALAATVTEEAIKQQAWLDLCDIAIASCTVYDIVHIWKPALGQLQNCIERARVLGDEPRRAALLAKTARFLTYGGRFEEADLALNTAHTIATRLGLQKTLLETLAVRGLWLADSRTSPAQGGQELQAVVQALHAVNAEPLVTTLNLANPEGAARVLRGRQPELCRVLLDLVHVSLITADNDALNQALDELDELTVEHFPGYLPEYYLTYADCLRVTEGDHAAKIDDLATRAAQIGKESGNPWVDPAVGKLKAALTTP